MAAPPVPRRLRFAAFEVPTYRWYWAVSALSTMGDGMENVIRNVLVLRLVGPEGAPFWLAMTIFAHWIPFTLFSLYGGALADRYDGRRVQIAAQVLLMVAAVGVAASTLLGFVNVWWINGLLLVHGVGGALGGPAQQTLIHSIVGRERLLSAVSLNSTARQLTQIVGPAIAGFIVVFFGPGWGFAVNALTFIPLLLFLTFLRIRRVGDVTARPVVEELREGLGFVRSRPRIASLISLEMLNAVFVGRTFDALLILFATQILGTNEVGYAFLLVASGIGAFGAAVYIGGARERARPGLFIVGTLAAEMIAVIAFAFSRSYVLSFVLLVVIGAAALLTQAYTNTTIQLAAPDRLRGRVMGAYSFGTQGFRIVNAPLLGSLALWLGAPVAVASSAGIVLVGVALILAAVPQLRASGADVA